VLAILAPVLARVPRLPFSLDPLIAEAKRRMRRRRLLVAALAVVVAGGGVGAAFALRSAGPRHPSPVAAIGNRPARPPSQVVPQTSVEIFSQSTRSAETAGRPLDKTLAVFHSSRLAATLPAPKGLMRPLADVAARMSGDPGALLLDQTRQVATDTGPLYLVPTKHGWVCMQARRFETCHHGLLQEGVSWDFESEAGGLQVMGIAADNVRSVVLRYGTTERRASLHDNVFFVYRPLSLPPAQPLPPLGTLAISYRDGTPATAVPLG
jgi:hypothetical protein